MISLIGVLIIILGFTLKFDVLATVVISGVVTGLVSGMGFNEVMSVLGSSFVNNRIMSIFIMSLPAIAIIERYGLKERAADWISSIKNATAGSVSYLYVIIRTIASALSIRLGGHVQFVRPLIYPMALAAGENKEERKLDEDEIEELKALTAATENYGNFFGQNIFVGAAGCLLIQRTLVEAGVDVGLAAISLYSIPIGVTAIIFTIIQSVRFDKKLKKDSE